MNINKCTANTKIYGKFCDVGGTQYYVIYNRNRNANITHYKDSIDRLNIIEKVLQNIIGFDLKNHRQV